ncbi:MAG: precorrin-8X methylmutase [Lachnospiraceae bacterium]|nr:precorrin-8X methylmutase [Lachnospiraceae bacterium]
MKYRPDEIEKSSMEIIDEELIKRGCKNVTDSDEMTVIKRVIHTTADFDYYENLCFINDPVKRGTETIKGGNATVVTDTNMALAGINKRALEKNGCEAVCFMNDERIIKISAERNITRAAASMEHAAALYPSGIYSIGNAPTALLSIGELIGENRISPALVIAVPVGFVNVLESKEYIKEICEKKGIPLILSEGRKGGSTVAVSVVNSILYMAGDMTDPAGRCFSGS